MLSARALCDAEPPARMRIEGSGRAGPSPPPPPLSSFTLSSFSPFSSTGSFTLQLLYAPLP